MFPQKTRYLIYFQYFGTKYSGVALTPCNQNTLGVQNYLEKAAEKLNPPAPIKFVISSRTDAGVHALCNTAHFDLERSDDAPPWDEEKLVQGLNYHLKPEPIGVLSARRVPDSFHARFSALSRTYVYRVVTGPSGHYQTPVFERDLCWATKRGHFNLEAMREAASYLRGTHNFMTFCSSSSELPFRNPVKHLARLEIRPASGFLMDHHPGSALKFWELEFTSGSFLYKQVRRMVGALVAVGQGHLQPYDVKKLLEVQDLMASSHITVAPPGGLFLKDVEYCESDLDIGPSDAEG
ncbi:tRNA pseudouridine synthase-like 1 [Pogona vitticeps]